MKQKKNNYNKTNALTCVTPSYKYSHELKLCLSMFQKKLPQGTTLKLVESQRDNINTELRAAIISTINTISVSEFMLIAKEPALLIGEGALEELVKILQSNPKLDCVLPSDIYGHSACQDLAYFTWNGFQKFVANLKNLEGQFIPYDDRTPFIFLVRVSALMKIDIPLDPMDIPKILRDKTAIALKAYVHPFFNYFEESREDIIELIPHGLNSFLDIGCARGHFGALLKSNFSECHVVGIEMNPYEAAEAQKRLDRVLVGDALTLMLEEKFDCVTCLDMIEHVADPEMLLTKIYNDFLLNKGYLILSIPNIGHWSVVEDLLAGRWDYIPAGLLCTTHLRFFTLPSIRNLLENNNFNILHIHAIKANMSESFKLGIESLKNLSIEIDETSLNTISYYILAQKKG